MPTNDPSPSTDLKLRVARDDSPPRGGWKFTVPETGMVLTELSVASLRDLVRRHYEVNDMKLPRGYREWFEDEMCRQGNLLGSVCEEVPKVQPPQVLSLSIPMIERFVKTIWGLSKGGDVPKLVEQEEAERRAAICARCPLNVSVHIPCKGCRGLIRRVGEVLGNRTTSLDDKLETCAACSCDLKLKIHISNEVIDKAEGRRMPEYWEEGPCWRLENSGE